MRIELKTNLGSIALGIAADCGDAAESIGKLAMQQVVYHVAPGKAFKKSSGHKRDDVYSSALEAAVEASVRETLVAAGFSDVEVIASEQPAKTATKAELEMTAARDAGKKAGLTDDILKVMFPKLYEAGTNGKEPVKAPAAEVVAS